MGAAAFTSSSAAPSPLAPRAAAGKQYAAKVIKVGGPKMEARAPQPSEDPSQASLCRPDPSPL